MSAELVGFSINHQTAPLAVRERLRLDESRSAALRSLLGTLTLEHLVLSTCERLEVYAVAEGGRGREALSAIVDFLHDGTFTGCNPFRVDLKSTALPRVVPAAPGQPWAPGAPGLHSGHNAVGVEAQIATPSTRRAGGRGDARCVLEGRNECSPGLQSGDKLTHSGVVPEGRLNGLFVASGLKPTPSLSSRIESRSYAHSVPAGTPTTHTAIVDATVVGGARPTATVVGDAHPTGFAQVLEGPETSRHLLRVAAGLESRIIGEPHVLGQVRQAYLTGLEQKTLGPILAALGRAAIHTGKRVRHETTINPTARSIVTLTLEALRDALGELSSSKVVVVGSGRLAGDLAAVLAYRGAQLRFASRSRERAQGLALRYQAPAGALDELPRLMADADAVIACSSATELVINRETISSASPAPSGARLVIFDLSVPRNVDPAVGQCPNVTLRHLDELLSGEKVRREGLAAGEKVVGTEAERFEQWRREREIAPRIAALSLRARASDSAEKETARRLHQRIMDLKWETAA